MTTIPGLSKYIIDNRSRMETFLASKYKSKYQKIIISIPSDDFIMVKFYLDAKYVLILTIANDCITNNSEHGFLYGIINDLKGFFRKLKIEKLG